MNRVTVVIATLPHRHEQLQRALDSVFAQTVTDLEVLVMPNGPDPALPAAIAADPRVRVLPLGRPWNFGCGAVNRLVAGFMVDTEFVAWLDDDNWFFPSHLEGLLNAIGDADCAYSQVLRETGQVTGWDWLTGPGAWNFIDTSCILYRTDSFAKARPDPNDGSGYEHLYFRRLMEAGGTYAFVPEATVQYTGYHQGA